jgi:uncharacterized protein YdiU (UPF0061 family)
MSTSVRLGLENTFAEQLEGLYAPSPPQGFASPVMVQLNRELLKDLGLSSPEVEVNATALFSGTLVPTDSVPLAQAYAGHQFGGFSPQLGDGRATLIGEVIDPRGRRHDLQLKGSGRTPFSRGGDGKATLGPILREYLMGEAMHHLGVRTTRVLAAVATGESIRRSEVLPGAVLTRVASSHLRVGTLEFFAARRDEEKLTRLVSYALDRHYPERNGSDEPARELLQAVAVSQAELIASWLHVGFIHGVMNTDNTSLAGETIDYGPCAFLEAYDPATAYSSIDHGGRYAFGNQASIGQWNLARMAEALLSMLAPEHEVAVEFAEGVLDLYAQTHESAWLAGMRRKLGLKGEQDADRAVITNLLAWMKDEGKDYTSTFRRLGDTLGSGEPAFEGERFAAWHAEWLRRLGTEEFSTVAARMSGVNPLYIPRNHLVEEALDAAIAGDLAPFRTLLEVLASPYEPQEGRERFVESAPADFGPYQTFCGT